MKLTIEGTPDELKNVFQAICGSEEHEILTILNRIQKNTMPVVCSDETNSRKKS